MGVVHSNRMRQRGGVRIEYIVAAIVSVALLVAMTAVLLSVSDRKAKRELVRQPNANVPPARPGPGETSSSAITKPSPSPGTPESPVVVTVTPQATPAATSETPVVVTVTPQSTPANTPDAPVVVTATPQPPAAAIDPGAEIAAYPLDTLKIGSRPPGNNWNFGFEGGIVSVQQSPQENSRCLRLLDNNPRATVWALRKFPSQSEHVGFECHLRIGQAADGYALAILGSDKAAVLLLTRGGELGCEIANGGWHTLQRYEPNVWYTIRISADVKDKTFSVYVDVTQRGDKLKFANPVQSVDAWQVETPNRTTGTLYISAMKVTER